MRSDPASAVASRDGVTVGDLVDTGRFGLRVVGGRAGLSNPVLWAQVTDAEAPWDWLDVGDLVLTSGGIVPQEPLEQATFVNAMWAAGQSGLVVGDHAESPRLSGAMVGVADRRGFPILQAPPDISWMALVRQVARSNRSGETRTLRAIMRVHDEVRIGLIRERSATAFLEALSAIVGCRLRIVDPDTWEPLLPGAPLPPDAWRGALTAARARRAGTPIAMRLEVEGTGALALPIPIERPATLLVELRSGFGPRRALLQHVAAACGLEIARTDAASEHDRRTGATFLAGALAGELEPEAAQQRLLEFGLRAPFVCAALDAGAESVERIERYCSVRELPCLLTRLDGLPIALIDSDGVAALDELSQRESVRIGVSEPTSDPTMLGDAGREARWALETVPRKQAGVAVYDRDCASLLPRARLEQEETVRRVLGPLLEHDAACGGALVDTLQTYLECDRSPKRAAAVLSVHPQTVNYRIDRIEDLVGRSLRSTADIAELWLALRARSDHLAERSPITPETVPQPAH